ncbi:MULTISPECIES: DMT family transporter [Emticicia]|uniref:DMT family transporter n=1 Tax=Emticicia TaxID=312278 RepID=UPI0007D8AD85|nr:MULTISPECIES: DMT family transporter [Emticicia]
MNTKPLPKDYLKLHLIVVILGFTAILGRLTEVSTLGVVFFRTFLAATGMWAVAQFQKKSLKISLAQAWPLLGVGAIMSFHWICFFGSARASTVAVSLVTFSTTSFFTSIIEPFVRKTKISWVEVILGVLVVMGMYFVFTFEGKYIVGILIGLVGALLSTVFSVINGQFAQKYDAQTVTFYEMVGAFGAMWIYIPIIIFALPNEHFQLIPTNYDWLWIGILGLVCTVYPYNEMMHLLKKISAFTLNLAINMEPIYGIIMAYFIFGESEKMTSGFYIGGILILLSVVLHPFLKKK